jgi:hypothetical protein
MNIHAYSIQRQPDWACIQVTALESTDSIPVHLVCIIDTSGSMAVDDKLDHVKKSLHFLLDFLRPQDQLTVLTFSDRVRTILNKTFVTGSEKENIRARLSFIMPEANTNMSAALIEVREVLRMDTNNVKQGVLLLTDGHATAGMTTPEYLVELAQRTITNFRGTTFSCIGYGTDHHAELLRNISQQGGGVYYVVNTLEDVAVVFGDVLGGLVSCSYQQVRILLPEGTELKTRYPVERENSVVKVCIGDLPAGMEAILIARMAEGQPLLLKAYDLKMHDNVTLNTTVLPTEDPVIQLNGEAHYLRFEVLALLEECNSQRNGTPSEHIAKIVSCISQITTYKAHNPHPLWDTLLEELQNSKVMLEGNDVSLQPIMVQRAAVLGRMRGIGSTPQASQASHASQASQASHAFSPMANQSNAVQRQLSQDLYSASQSAEQPGQARQVQHAQPVSQRRYSWYDADEDDTHST